MSRLRSRLLVPGGLVALLLVVFPGGTRGAFPDELRLPKYQECWALPADELAMLRRARQERKRLKDVGPELVSAGVLGPRATLASLPRIVRELDSSEQRRFLEDTLLRLLGLVPPERAAATLCELLKTSSDETRKSVFRAVYLAIPSQWSRSAVEVFVSYGTTSTTPQSDVDLLALAAALSLLRGHPHLLGEVAGLKPLCTQAAAIAHRHPEVWAECVPLLGMYPEPKPHWVRRLLHNGTMNANHMSRALAHLTLAGDRANFAVDDYSVAVHFPSTYPIVISSLYSNFLRRGTSQGDQFCGLPGLMLGLELVEDGLARRSEPWSREVLRLVHMKPIPELALSDEELRRLPYFNEHRERLCVDCIALQCQCEGTMPTRLLATSLDTSRNAWIRAHCVRRLSEMQAGWGRGTRIPLRASLRADDEWPLAAVLLANAGHWASSDELLGAVEYLLSNDSSPFWLSTIAAVQGLTSANVDLSVELARRISEHPCAEVRQGLARYVRGKPKYREVSRALKADEDDYVRDAVGER